ncbi:MAG: DUF3368 domain-containing protein [Deltaproteobacteria bacterium]|nr:MAG: DUF3368 domain-containing protein [Deltaproteobacteria bacterium]
MDEGESEAIALAVCRNADLILLDESEARRIAELYNLSKTGVIGLLIRAKQEKLIDSLKTELDRLMEGGFWIDQNLYNQALVATGER